MKGLKSSSTTVWKKFIRFDAVLRLYDTRLGFEKKNNVSFRWVVNARPDVVLVNDLPDLRKLNHDGVVYVPSWGHGYNPREASKRHPGINDRFAFGGAGAMGTYHDLYARMCHDGWAMDDGGGVGESEEQEGDSLPGGLNFEQMLHWYLNHRRVGETTGGAGKPPSLGGKLRSTRHIPGEFWFFRLRMGSGTTPVEHPGHRPAMVMKDDDEGGSGGGGSWGDEVRLGRKRWEVWSAATREAWMCQGGRKEERFKEAAVDCWLRSAGAAYHTTEWVRWLSPRTMVPEPGRWLDRLLQFSCGVVHPSF